MNKKIISILLSLLVLPVMAQETEQSKLTSKVNKENEYLREAYKNIPDMQDVGKVSNERSKKEGAALQIVGASDISSSGFSLNSFNHLLELNNNIFKEYGKTTKIKGYIILKYDILMSKGKIEKFKNIKEYQDAVECKNEYCVFVVTETIKLLDENKRELNINKELLNKLSKKYSNKNILWEIDPTKITKPYDETARIVILGYGLNGLDATDLAKK